MDQPEEEWSSVNKDTDVDVSWRLIFCEAATKNKLATSVIRNPASTRAKFSQNMHCRLDPMGVPGLVKHSQPNLTHRDKRRRMLYAT